jgi:Spy/CpxP family protein refolding chaperone
MKRKTDSTQAPSTGPSLKSRLIRAGALAAVIGLGTATVLFTFSPTARAFAVQTASDSHDSMFASMHGGHSSEQMHAHFDKVLTDAGASDAQKQQIHTIMKDAMTAEHADMQRFHDSCGRLKDLLTADPIDDAAVQQVRADQDRLVLATSHRLSDTMVAVARVLNPRQRAKLGAEIDRMLAQHDMHHHGG